MFLISSENISNYYSTRDVALNDTAQTTRIHCAHFLHLFSRPTFCLDIDKTGFTVQQTHSHNSRTYWPSQCG